MFKSLLKQGAIVFVKEVSRQAAKNTIVFSKDFAKKVSRKLKQKEERNEDSE